ncbi:MAG: hypothetical protein WDA00_01410 [Eubacteriales bacterium]
MTVSELATALDARLLTAPAPDRKVNGAYAGDLLSWVMGRAAAGQAWVTIMTNINVVAVASLLELSAVILCDNALPEPAVLEAAEARGVNLLLSRQPVYELCGRLHRLGI